MTIRRPVRVRSLLLACGVLAAALAQPAYADESPCPAATLDFCQNPSNPGTFCWDVNEAACGALLVPHQDVAHPVLPRCARRASDPLVNLHPGRKPSGM